MKTKPLHNSKSAKKYFHLFYPSVNKMANMTERTKPGNHKDEEAKNAKRS